MFFVIISAVHISGGFSFHHQALKKLYMQPGVVSFQFQTTHTNGRQRESMAIPKAAHRVL
jgi:hypothetical protein